MPGMRKNRQKKLSDQIRKAVDKSGVTRYRLAKETGIDQGALSRFHHGKAGLSLNALDRLGAYLGLEIITQKDK